MPPGRRAAEGLFFAVRIDDAVTTFEGLPIAPWHPKWEGRNLKQRWCRENIPNIGNRNFMDDDR